MQEHRLQQWSESENILLDYSQWPLALDVFSVTLNDLLIYLSHPQRTTD